MNGVYREITPLTPYDCFTIFARHKDGFDFPLHYHEEYELNLIVHGEGVKRIVGDHSEVISGIELVLVGCNLPHGWFTHQYTHQADSPLLYEITLQFHRDLLDEKMMRRNQLSFIRTMLERSSKGILFSPETAQAIFPRLHDLSQMNGFDSVLELFSILHDLSTSRNMRMLSSNSFSTSDAFNYHSRRIEQAFEFMRTHYQKDISLEDLSRHVGMTEVSFSRFIKKRTGKTFVDSLNEIRLGHASRLLIDTTETVAEIAYKCGFNNLSYFNRVFKNRKGCTPKSFRESYSGPRMFI